MWYRISLIALLVVSLNPGAYCQNYDDQVAQLEYQIGVWEDDKELKTQDGRIYKFNYKLEWFDRAKKIIKMQISGIFKDGEVRTFWEGFKHWDLTSNRFVYNGFSPDGRIAQGYIEIGLNEITTHYSSNTPNGKIEIRDVALKTDNDHFTTTTHIKMPGQAEWKIVNKDNWSRISSEK